MKSYITKVWLPGTYKEKDGSIYRAYMVAPLKLGAKALFGFTQRDETPCFFWQLSESEFLVTYEDYLLMEKINDDYVSIPFTNKELKIIKSINHIKKSRLEEYIADNITNEPDLGACIDLYTLNGLWYDGKYNFTYPRRYFDLIRLEDIKKYIKEER